MDLRRPSFTDPNRASSYHSGSSVESTSVRSSSKSDVLPDVDGVDGQRLNVGRRRDEGLGGYSRRIVGDDEFERGVGLLSSVEGEGMNMDAPLTGKGRGNGAAVESHQMTPLTMPKRSSSRQGVLSSFSSTAGYSQDIPGHNTTVPMQISAERNNIFAPIDTVDSGDTSTSTLGLGVGDDPFAVTSNPSPRRVRGVRTFRTSMTDGPSSIVATLASTSRRPTHQPSLETIKTSSTNLVRDEIIPEDSDEEPVGVIAALESNQKDFGDLYPETSEALKAMAIHRPTSQTPRRASNIVVSTSSTPRQRPTAQPTRRHTSLTMRYAMGDSTSPPVSNHAYINHIDSDDDHSRDGRPTIVPKTFPRTFVSPRRRTRPHRRRAVSGPVDLDSTRFEYHEEDQDISLDADPPKELELRFPVISPRRSLLLSPGVESGAGRSSTSTNWSSTTVSRNASAASRLATGFSSEPWVNADDPVMDEMLMNRVREEVEVVRRKSGFNAKSELGNDDDLRQAMVDDVFPASDSSNLGAVLVDELRSLRREMGDLRHEVRALAGSRTTQVSQDSDPVKPMMVDVPEQDEMTIVPNHPEILKLIRKLDILVHHLPRETDSDISQPNTTSRNGEQVFSTKNLALLGQVIEDWECVIRGRDNGVQ